MRLRDQETKFSFGGFAAVASRLGLASIVALAVGSSACTTSSDGDQCAVDADCASRGNFVCSEAKICVAGQAPVDPPVVVVTPPVVQTMCTTTEACTAANGNKPSLCRNPGAEPCINLDTIDCKDQDFGPYEHVIGDWQNPNAVFIGATLGYEPTSYFYVRATRAMQMAIDDINRQLGGLPPETAGGPRRPLVSIQCSQAHDFANAPVRAAKYLLETVKAPMLMSQNEIDATPQVNTFVQNKALDLCIECVQQNWAASSVDGYFRTVIPTNYYDPEIIGYIGEMNETKIRTDRGLAPTDKIKVAFLSSTNAPGDQLYASKVLDTFKYNGIVAKDNGTNLLVVQYEDPTYPTSSGGAAGGATFDAYGVAQQVIAFEPDIVVVTGTALGMNRIPWPIEAFWPAGKPHPYYLTGRSGRNTNVLDYIGQNEDIRKRIAGATSALPVPATIDDEFQLRYKAKYGGERADGIAYYYDALIAYAYATVAAGSTKGELVRAGFSTDKLGTGAKFTVAPADLINGVAALTTAGSIDLQGRYGSMKFDATSGLYKGAGGTAYCVERATAGGGAAFKANFTLRYDPAGAAFSGAYAGCP